MSARQGTFSEASDDLALACVEWAAAVIEFHRQRFLCRLLIPRFGWSIRLLRLAFVVMPRSRAKDDLQAHLLSFLDQTRDRVKCPWNRSL